MDTKCALVFFGLVAGSLAAIQAPPDFGITLDTLKSFSFGGTKDTQLRRFPQCQNGMKQTPIAIEPPYKPDPSARLQFSDDFFQPTYVATIGNSGHFAQVSLKPTQRPFMATFKGILYQFSQIHFHTGTADDNGCDHPLEGQRFPLEAHMAMFQPKYQTLRNALDKPDPTACLFIATLFKIGNYNPIFDTIVKNIRNIVPVNQTVTIKPRIAFSSFIPFGSTYYWYDGSLEAPPCQESIRWIVYDQPLDISEGQMSLFRHTMKLSSGNLQIKSWRYIQSRNGRDLFVVPGQNTGSSGPSFAQIVNLYGK